MPPFYPPERSVGRRQRPGFRWSGWNLLLLLPLLILLTPIYNRTEPKLFGVPFFYWAQFGSILLGMLCTFAVYQLTRHVDHDETNPVMLLDVNQQDEGTWR